MHQISLDSWERLEEALSTLRSSLALNNPAKRVLYRGLGDSRWKLDSTLERSGRSAYPVWDYYRFIHRIKPEIEAFTGKQWKMPDLNLIRKDFEEYDRFSIRLSSGKLPAYQYLAYLRHHGLPSPLIDWTRSAFIASFFAYRQPTGEHVSIYAYLDSVGGKLTSNNLPAIYSFGPYIATHRRHFLQQAEYTCGLAYRDERWLFVPHSEVFDDDDPIEQQDLLWKFDLPATERAKVLRQLDLYNLNAHSLFGSEDSLVETLAAREMHLRDE